MLLGLHLQIMAIGKGLPYLQFSNEFLPFSLVLSFNMLFFLIIIVIAFLLIFLLLRLFLIFVFFFYYCFFKRQWYICGDTVSGTVSYAHF